MKKYCICRRCTDNNTSVIRMCLSFCLLNTENTLHIELQLELFDFCTHFFFQQITYYPDDVLIREL